MKKPDRLERLVDRHILSTSHPLFKNMVRKAAVLMLLRRERARLRRKVRGLDIPPGKSDQYFQGYFTALDDVLKMMEE